MWNLRKSRVQTPASFHRAKPARRGNVGWWTERLLLVAGLALLIFWGVARIESSLRSAAALREFAKFEHVDTIDAVPVTPGVPSHLPLDPTETFHLWSDARVRAYRKITPASPPLAILRIAKIHLIVPVQEGTDDLILNHAVGRIGGTARPGEAGNIGIAGHRDSFFRGLKDVRIGDAIELQTLQGRNTYIVDHIQIVTPNRVEVLEPSSVPSLTLVTCYPFYFFGGAPQRYIVTAALAQETQAASATAELAPAPPHP